MGGRWTSRRWRKRLAAGVLGSMLFSIVVGIVPASAQPYCDPTWQYSINSKAVGGRFGHLGNWYVNYNGTGSKQTTTLTSTTTGTITESASVSVTAEASAFVFAKVSATVDASIQHQKSTSVTNSVSFSTPSHYYGNGGYGFYKTRVSGHLYYLTSICQTGTDYGTVVFKYPRGAVGWCTWNSTAAEGPAGNVPVACQP